MRILERHCLEFGAIQQMRFIAHAEQQRKRRRRRMQVSLQHRSERRDPGSRADENRIARWLPQNEHPQRLAHLDAIAWLHFEQSRRKMTGVYARSEERR